MTLRHYGRALVALSGAVLLCATLSAPVFAMSTSDTDATAPIVVAATDEESAPITVTATHTDSHGNKVHEGDLITVTPTHTNNTDNAFTVFPVDSNLFSVLITGVPSCRWHNLAAHTAKQRMTATHTVTAVGVAAGSFTPTSTWVATRGHNGTDITVGDATASVDPMTVTQSDCPPAPDPLETSQDYAIGDRVRLVSPSLAGFSCHRIPALTTTNNGWIVVSWDGHPNTCQDAPQANSIAYRISKDGGKSWTPIKTALAGTLGAQKTGYSDSSFVVGRTTGTIFLLSAKSYDASPFQSQLGTDPVARNILHTHVAESRDNGETWGNPRTITNRVAAGYEGQQFTRFASSGEGIQLRYGVHAGRLIQQYAVVNSGTTSPMAISVYSNDHDMIWKSGVSTGGSADENRVVEPPDGHLLLDSCMQGTVGQRFEAISYDGGQTRGLFRHNQDLTDPYNSASIVRAYPDAPEGSARARVLPFSNTGSANARANGTVRISHDDGFTWNDGKVFESGEMAYSTLHPLGDSTWGPLHESGGHRNIEFMHLDADYLGLTDPGEEDAPEPEPTPDSQP